MVGSAETDAILEKAERQIQQAHALCKSLDEPSNEGGNEIQ